MGSDSEIFMTNLLLFIYESKWVLQIKKSYLEKARKFANAFRFIDDLYVIKDNWFEKNFKEICDNR